MFIIWEIWIVLFCFKDGDLLCGPDWPRNHGLPASVSRVLELQVYTAWLEDLLF